MISKQNIILLLCAMCTSAFAIGFGFVALDRMEAVLWIKRYEYWLLLLTALCFGYACIQTASKHSLWASVRQWIFPAVFVSVVSLLLLASQPREMKIVMDEPVLMATALQMHELRESKTAARGYEVNGSFVLLGGYVDKRPALFPFTVSLMHDLTGYRATQGLVLNALLSPLFVVLLFIAGRLVWREWGGYLAVCLFATVPLLAMNMTGSGFELLNLVLLVGAILTAYLYMNQPSKEVMGLLILLGVLLAHTRYESALFVVPVGFLIVYEWWQSKRMMLSWTAVLAPLLLVSIPLRRIIHRDNDEMWQLDKNDAASPFSIEFASSNLRDAWSHFFAFDVDQPNSMLLSALFVIAVVLLLGLLVLRIIRVRAQSTALIVGAAFGAVMLLNFGILMCYFWGQIDDIMATRIALPFILFQVLFVVAVAAQIKVFRATGPVLLSVSLLYFIGVSRPLSARSDFIMRSPRQQEVDWLSEYVTSNSSRNILYISNRHMVPILHHKSALIVKDSIRSKLFLDLHLRLHTFEEVQVVYFVPLDEELIAKDTATAQLIEEHFVLESLINERLNRFGDIRVDRVVGVRVSDELRAKSDQEVKLLFNGESDIQDFSKTLP